MQFQQRRSPRLARHDYGTPGAYFVTVVVHQRRCLSGSVIAGSAAANAAGCMVRDAWGAMPGRYAGVDVEPLVVMPNHVHGILWIADRVSNTLVEPSVPARPTVPDLLRRFKTLTTRRYIEGVERHGWPPFEQRLWQRSYYDRVIRNDVELNAFREYVATNPIRWTLDREFP